MIKSLAISNQVNLCGGALCRWKFQPSNPLVSSSGNQTYPSTSHLFSIQRQLSLRRVKGFRSCVPGKRGKDQVHVSYYVTAPSTVSFPISLFQISIFIIVTTCDRKIHLILYLHRYFPLCFDLQEVNGHKKTNILPTLFELTCPNQKSIFRMEGKRGALPKKKPVRSYMVLPCIPELREGLVNMQIPRFCPYKFWGVA